MATVLFSRGANRMRTNAGINKQYNDYDNPFIKVDQNNVFINVWSFHNDSHTPLINVNGREVPMIITNRNVAMYCYILIVRLTVV